MHYSFKYKNGIVEVTEDTEVIETRQATTSVKKELQLENIIDFLTFQISSQKDNLLKILKRKIIKFLISTGIMTLIFLSSGYNSLISFVFFIVYEVINVFSTNSDFKEGEVIEKQKELLEMVRNDAVNEYNQEKQNSIVICPSSEQENIPYDLEEDLADYIIATEEILKGIEALVRYKRKILSLYKKGKLTPFLIQKGIAPEVTEIIENNVKNFLLSPKDDERNHHSN